MEALKEALNRLDVAYNHFNNASDGYEIDSAIFEIKSAEALLSKFFVKPNNIYNERAV